jgi:16S rRNA (cytidine1402-2'-O)-methyltransferase
LETIEKGTLYLVSTPIGNLADISYRAVHILKNVDLIAAEDTRTSGVLLNRYEIKTRVSSYHSYNVKTETARLVQKLLDGMSIALISDAGTPDISDPGFNLVKACTEQNIPVVPIPGASALIAALVASGLATHRFVYEGFLPLKKGRRKRMEFLAGEERTIVIYESPHRIERTVREFSELFGERHCVMAREITKKFEEFFRGTLAELLEHLQSHSVKGEIVLLIEGLDPKKLKKRKEDKWQNK